jgi:DNA-directed RNA polymerase subunit RPC12/RpoP
VIRTAGCLRMNYAQANRNGPAAEIQCPHCDAVYRLGRVNPYPAPYVCLRCGRKMYDGRQYLIPAYDDDAN